MVFAWTDSSRAGLFPRHLAPALLVVLAVASANVPAQDDVELLRSIAAPENGPPPFDEAAAIALDDDGTVHLTDPAGKWYVFRADATVQTTLNDKDGIFRSRKVSGIARLDADTFALANVGDDRIVAVAAGARGPATVLAGDGRREGLVYSPEGLAYSPGGRLYVADRGNNRVSVFTRAGHYLFSFGDRGAEAALLKRPVQVAVDLRERVCVLDDRDDGVLMLYSAAGEFLKRIVAAELKGDAERPPRLGALAVDDAGHLFVADNANGRILEYDPDAARVLYSFGSKGASRGQFDKVTALAVSRTHVLAVADSGNRRIDVYRFVPTGHGIPPEAPRLPLVRDAGSMALADCIHARALPDGRALCVAAGKVYRVAADGKREALAGEFASPKLAAFDERHIAVVDGDRLKVFGHDGVLRFALGGAGTRPGEFDAPAGVLLADRLYVADSGNRRVQVFSRDGVFLDKIGANGDAGVLQRPGALALDARGNLYVADNGDGRIRVFGPPGESGIGRKMLFQLGEVTEAPTRWQRIDDLALDRDDRLYVLGATPGNDAVVRVYAGPRAEFAFGSAGDQGAAFARPVALSLIDKPQPALAVFDAGRAQLRRFHYLQVPGQVGGVAVAGGPQQTVLKWQKVPGGFVERYRVTGAADAGGPFEAVTETTAATATLAPARSHHYYRVSAVSLYGVEGPGSVPRQDFFRSGFQLFAEKRYAEAAEQFAVAHRETPDSGAAREYLARCFIELGRYDDALVVLQDLEKAAGSEAAALNLQIEALLRAREYARARGLVDRARAERRADGQTFSLCGRTALALNDPLGASECFEQALKLGRDDADTRLLLGQAYARLNATAKAVTEFDKAAALAPDNAATWLQGGLALQSLRLHKEALERFDKALALDPAGAPARLGAARSHVALQHYDEAQSIASALTGNPEQEAAGAYLLGVIAQGRKQPQDAVLHLTRATTRDPKNVAAWLALADARAELGDKAGLLEALRAATRADRDNLEARQRLGAALQAAGEHTEAVEHLAHAVEVAPNRYEARLAYATSLLALERLKDAAQQAGEAARLAAAETAPLVLGADIAQRQGRHGDAISQLTRALKLKPNVADVHLHLGAVYLETSAYDQAQTHLDKAALLEPRNGRPHALLGDMYLDRRLFDAAIRSYTKAQDLNPSPENQLHLNTAYAEKKKAGEFRQNAPRVLLQDLKLTRVFSAAYKQYASEPVGSVKLRNLSQTEYRNLRLSFHIKGYMDFPVTTEIPQLKPQETLELPLAAALSNRVLALDEDTGVQAEVKVTFFQDGHEAAAELTRPLTIYGKNAILWRESLMVGSFITPRDETLKEFVRAALAQYGATTGALNRNLAQAMTLFDMIGATGTRYLADPNSPYARVSADQVDYVQFPRETLRSRSGDCDDLTVLLAAALENVGIETALVEVPGHLFLLFSTGLPAAQSDQVSTQDDLLVVRDGIVWVPLETTMIATSFSEAWTEGARKYREHEQAQNVKVVPVKSAWERYAPVTLAPAGYTLDVPGGEHVKLKLGREHAALLTRSLERLVRPYRALLQADPKDQEARMQIAIVYARNGLAEPALHELERILELNAGSSAAHNNRGNIYYTQGEYERALEAYRYAAQLDPSDGGIKLNLALAQYRLGRTREATDSFNEAVTLDRALEQKYQALRKLLGG
jgi:tetratricopeptide (TPR) repeat protein/sugar lactone lactonase YvrE